MLQYLMTVFLIAAFSAFSQDFNVDNTFTHWKQNKSNWIRPFGTYQVKRNEDHAQLSVEATSSSPVHLFTTASYPVKVNDRIEIKITAKGRGSAEFGIYFGDASGTTFGLDRFHVKVTGENMIYKHIFTVRQQGKKLPDRIHLFIGAAKDSMIVFGKISAHLTEQSAHGSRYAVDAEGNVLLDSFSSLRNWSVQQNKYPSPEPVVENGRAAMKLTLPSIVMGRNLVPLGDGMRFADFEGISLEVKGDGSDNPLPVTVAGISSNIYYWRYTVYIPVQGTEWQRIRLAWSDFVAPDGLMPSNIGDRGTLTPSGIGTVIFGDAWTIGHGNRAIRPHSIMVRELRMLRKASPQPFPDYPAAPLKNVIAKMRSGKPVLIFCAGDSITAGTTVRDPDRNRYAVKLETLLRQKFGNPGIRVRTIAVGGAKTRDLRVWATRDYTDSETPDLMMLLIGYNDKSYLYSTDYYRASVRDYLRRVRSLTRGKTAFLLMPPIPGQGARYTMMDDYADIIRALPKQEDITVFDLAREFKAMPEKVFSGYFSDMAHPNNAGHAFIAEKIAAFLSAEQ